MSEMEVSRDKRIDTWVGNAAATSRASRASGFTVKAFSVLFSCIPLSSGLSVTSL